MKKTAEEAKYLVVISYDAFSEDNWEVACKLPNLSRLIKNGSYTTKLKSVYPSLTYVAHTTMVTGVYPNKHGVFHNNPFQPFVPEKEQRWFWYRKDIKVPVIYDRLKEYNMKTAGLLWPVTGKASITYNIPEIRAIGNENQIIKALRNGSPLYSIEMQRKFGHIRKGIEQPYLDDFTTKCATDTIIRKRPNLLLLHLIDLDDAKHAFGTDSDEVIEVIERMDRRLGDIMSAVRKAGTMKQTVFMVIGDHGQINVRYKVKLNKLLMEQGLIYEENGKLIWRAYFQSCGGSAYLHIRQGDDEAETLVLAKLKEAARLEHYGIERVYSSKELKDIHISSSTKYIVEAKASYCFEDGLEGIDVIDLQEQKTRYATHGYLPDKPNYHSNLIISGAGIKKGYQFNEVNMVDIAPTMAMLLGVDFADCDGSPIGGIYI